MNKVSVAKLDSLEDRKPAYALVGEVDLVVVRFDDDVSVFYGRCLHRGALMSDGFVQGDNLICGVHYWDYRLDSGVSNTTTRRRCRNSPPGLRTARCWSTRRRSMHGPRKILSRLIAMPIWDFTPTPVTARKKNLTTD